LRVPRTSSIVVNRLLSLTPAGPAEALSIFSLQLAGPAVFSLDGLVDLLPVDWDFGRCLNSQTYFITANVNNGDNDVVTNNNALVTLSREDKHGALVLGGGIVVGGGRVCRVYPWRGSRSFSEWFRLRGYFVLQWVGILDDHLTAASFRQV
jgi:hypothetical protein